MEKITITLPLKDEVDYTIECLPEDIQVKGNVTAIDDETDQANENYIISELENGNNWAWCVAKVTANWKGIKGTDYLGCSSYKSEKDFIENSGYYQDMKDNAYSELIEQIKRLSK